MKKSIFIFFNFAYIFYIFSIYCLNFMFLVLDQFISNSSTGMLRANYKLCKEFFEIIIGKYWQKL